MRVLSAIVAWSLRNRAVCVIVTLCVVVLGVRSAIDLPIDVVPDVTSVQVQVITSAPALSPVDVEQYVTVPVERAMGGLPHATEVRSVSKYGLSVVTVVFTEDTDLFFARQLVSERMASAEAAIPAHYGKPEMGPATTALGEVFQFVVRNPHLSPMELQELLNWTIRPQLRTVAGVVDVNVIGGLTRQYEVMLDPARLNAAGVSTGVVFRAIESANANVGAGYIERNGEHIVVGTDGLLKSLDDIEQTVVVPGRDGPPLTVGALGEVRFGAQLRRGAATKDGEGEVVLGIVLMLAGENALAVTNAVKARLAAIQPSLPPGTTIEPSYDRSVLVGTTIRTVAKNLVEGAALVIVVLFVLLGDLRAGVVVATVIPLALLVAVMAMRALGLSGNLMSLGAIDFGLLVDGAVIIVENSVRRISERQAAAARLLTPEERSGVIEAATLEVRSASVYGEAIIAIVYVPILALTGVEGKLFRPMATTVLLGLSGAFVLSLTLVPVLTSLFVRPALHVEHRRRARAIERLEASFASWLARAMRHRWTVLTTAAVALAGAALLFARIGGEFAPRLDEGDILVELRRLPGIAISGSVATATRVERAFRGVAEVVGVVSRTGSPELANDSMGIEETDVYVQLRPQASWGSGRTKAMVAADLMDRARTAVPEVATNLTQPIQMRTSELDVGIKSDVGVLLYGEDLDELVALGNRVVRALRKVPGVKDVWFEQMGQLRYLRVTPDRSRLARYGLSVADVNDVVETVSVGHPMGEVLEGERRFRIVAKTAVNDSDADDAILTMPIKAATGRMLTLGDVARLDARDGPVEIGRVNQARRVTVEFNVIGADLQAAVRAAQAAVARDVRVPTGYRVEWGGQYEHYRDARQRLLVVVPAALSLIFFLLWLAFRSLRAATLILVDVPFAVVGGVVALWLRGLPFSISAAVGFIALFGVAVLNGLVLVSFSRHLEERGMDPAEAIQRASERRLRPVLMTALVAALGFMPMALSTSPGSEVQRPLATVVIGGIVSATLLTLFVLPVLYGIFGGASGAARSRPGEHTGLVRRETSRDHPSRPSPEA